MTKTRHALSILAVLAVAGSTSAHGTVCMSRNDQNATVSTALTTPPGPGANPNYHAYRFVPTNNLFPHSAWVFTGSPNRFDYMRIEIWSDNGGAPGSRIAGGAMAAPQSADARWLGSNFESLIFLQLNTPYWFVWVEPGESIIPEEPGSADLLPRYRRVGNGAWTATGSGAAKIRLFCGDTIDSPSVQRVGSPCSSALDQRPYAWTNDEPTVGNAGFGIEGVHLPSAANSWLLLGFDPAFVPIPLQSFGAPFGCNLYVAGNVTLTGSSGAAEIGDPPAIPRPPAAGHVRFPLPVPNNSGLSGLFFSAQIVTFDSASGEALPLVFSNGLHITLQ